MLDIRYAALDRRLAGMGLQRGALYELLDQAWQRRGALHSGTRIVLLAPDLRSLRDATGRRHGPFDLIIAADGAASQLRSQVAAPRRDTVYPCGALWCLVDAQCWEHANTLRQRYAAARRMIGMLPVGTRPGDTQQKLSFFWSLPRDGLMAWEQQGISPGNRSWPHRGRRAPGSWGRYSTPPSWPGPAIAIRSCRPGPAAGGCWLAMLPMR